MKKILVAFDDTHNAIKGATYAAQVAERTGATLILFEAVEPIYDQIARPYVGGKLKETMDQSRVEELRNMQKNLAEIYPGMKSELRLGHGTAHRSIAAIAEKENVDLIIMGTGGAFGLKEIFKGSVTANTIRKSRVPVLTIPGIYLMEEPDNILVATHHFEKDEKLLGPVIEIASLFSATIHVAVFMDTDTAGPVDYLENTREMERYLEFLRKTYPGINFRGELLEGKEFEPTLEKYDREKEVDMIVMFAYPKNTWQKLMRKSRTRAMAFHTTIPLLAIPVKV
jgi:nucleotide-binding universal stress UspA family protein